MTTPYDSVFTTFNSDGIGQTEFYKQGVSLPDHTVAMAERGYAMGSDDVVVVCLAVMFCIMAVIFFRGRTMLKHRLKDFFTSKRLYSEEPMSDNSNEIIYVFTLIFIGAMSLSLAFFDDQPELYSLSGVMGVPYRLFLAGGLFGLLFVYLKACIYYVVNWVFFDSESNKRWMLSYFTMTSLTAFFFYPISLVDIFYGGAPRVVTACTILVVFLYEILLFYRLFSNFKLKKHVYLPIFLYFCSVELLPALVLWNVSGWLTDNIIVKNLIY